MGILYREPYLGKDFVLLPNSRSTRESPKRKCPHLLMFCAKGHRANLRRTLTTAGPFALKRNQTIATFDSSLETCSIARASPMIMCLIGTCSSLEEAEVQKLRLTHVMLGNEDLQSCYLPAL